MSIDEQTKIKKGKYAFIFAVLNIADVVTTYAGVELNGLLEVNPLMNQAIGVSWFVFAMVKYLIGMFIMEELYMRSDFLVKGAKKRKVSNVVGFGIIGIYACVVIMNIMRLLM